MKLNQLKPAEGSVFKRKRLGRGEASGKGGTSTKGNKGHQSRSGFKLKMAHEGGQMPLQRRIPKRGFKNIHRQEFKIFNLGQLQQLIEKYDLSEISYTTLYQNKLIQKGEKIKILAQGILEKNVPFIIDSISSSAKIKLEKSGCLITLNTKKKT